MNIKSVLEFKKPWYERLRGEVSIGLDWKLGHEYFDLGGSSKSRRMVPFSRIEKVTELYYFPIKNPPKKYSIAIIYEIHHYFFQHNDSLSELEKKVSN